MAHKTAIKGLNESYVFCFQQRATTLLDNIKGGLEQEGLGDLKAHVSLEIETAEGKAAEEEIIDIRERFRKFAGRVYLPVFVVKEGSKWRQLSYEMDVLSRIDWSLADARFRSPYSDETEAGER